MRRVLLAQRPLEAPREHLEQAVAVLVPERVVDLLEAVEVEEDDRELRPVPAGLLERSRGGGPEQRAIRESRERIVVGEMLVLRDLLAQPSRRAPGEAEERRPEQKQASDEHDRDLGAVVPHLGCDRRVVEVELQDGRIGIGAAAGERRVDAECLVVGPSMPQAAVGQCGRERPLAGTLVVEETGVAGVERPTTAVPDHEACDVGVPPEHPAERLEADVVEALLRGADDPEVAPELGDELRRLDGGGNRALLGLGTEVQHHPDAERGHADGARDCEAAEQSYAGKARHRTSGAATRPCHQCRRTRRRCAPPNGGGPTRPGPADPLPERRRAGRRRRAQRLRLELRRPQAGVGSGRRAMPATA